MPTTRCISKGLPYISTSEQASWHVVLRKQRYTPSLKYLMALLRYTDNTMTDYTTCALKGFQTVMRKQLKTTTIVKNESKFFCGTFIVDVKDLMFSTFMSFMIRISTLI